MTTNSLYPSLKPLWAPLALLLAFTLNQPAQAALADALSALHSQTKPELLQQPLFAAAHLASFYPEAKPLWYQNSQPSANATALLAAIADLPHEGLNPEDYHHSTLTTQCQTAPLAEALLTPCELLFTDAFITLSQHLGSGKIAPETLNPEWKRKSPRINLATVFTQLQQGTPLAQILQNLRPQYPDYTTLITALKAMRQTAETAPDWPAINNAPAIKPSMTDERLSVIIQRLIFWGFLPNTYKATGHYDASLQAAVKAFQQEHGMDTDSVIGKATLNMLNVSPQQRVQQLQANLERWRWLPDAFSEKYLLVNIPSYELIGVNNHQVELRKPVIIGRPTRRTPIFSSRITQILLNPPWRVPTKLAVEDKLPEIRRDPEFLTKLGIDVYERDTLVSPLGVPWRRLNKNNFPYRLVQRPGPQNALGQIKFVIPNTDDIYLHDTPTRNLFSRNERAFSSGCVRVHKPLELALWLLQDPKWDSVTLQFEVETGLTHPIELKTAVPVHFQYWTAVVDEQGQVRYRTDLYEQDAPLWHALQQPPQPLQ